MISLSGGETLILDDRAYGFQLGFRPENVGVYEEKATTLCNGTRAGWTCGVIENNVYSPNGGV